MLDCGAASSQFGHVGPSSKLLHRFESSNSVAQCSKKILIAIVTTFDTIWCSTVALPAHDLAALGHPRSCSIASSRAIQLSSAHMLQWYRSQVV